MSVPVDIDATLAHVIRETIQWRRALPSRLGLSRAAVANPALDLILEMAWARLKRPNRPLRVTDLAYGAELPLNTARRHIAALRAAGIVAVEVTPGDRRSRTVSFTDTGWERAQAALQSLQWVPF